MRPAPTLHDYRECDRSREEGPHAALGIMDQAGSVPRKICRGSRPSHDELLYDWPPYVEEVLHDFHSQLGK